MVLTGYWRLSPAIWAILFSTSLIASNYLIRDKTGLICEQKHKYKKKCG
jgi:hypothetical protein